MVILSVLALLSFHKNDNKGWNISLNFFVYFSGYFLCCYCLGCHYRLSNRKRFAQRFVATPPLLFGSARVLFQPVIFSEI
jgi:hypothetical protein